MKSCPFRLLALLILIHSSSFGQKRLKKADRTIVSNIQAHVEHLGAETMQGRKAGTDGENLAGEYIIRQFTKSGLIPKGDTGSWFQPFEIYDGKEVKPSSQLSINGHGLRLFKDYFPFSFSANKNAEAAVAIALAENGVPWFKDIKEIINSDDDSTESDTLNIIRARANNAAKKGATALIIYNKSGKPDLEFNKFDRSGLTAIPVLYISKGAFKKYCSDESAILDVKLNVELEEKKRMGKNVIGYADNGADSTIVTAAHLDEETGVAALIEVARLLKSTSSKKRNYAFIAYSGEQKGLNGINYFSEHPSIDLKKVNCTVDIDLVAIQNENPKGLEMVKRSVEIIKNK